MADIQPATGTEQTAFEDGQAAGQPVTNVQVTVQQPAQVIIKGKQVSKVTYVLLAFFLGGLGIHNFYAGKTGLGILYLLFCWTFIPAIAALVQGIVALCKPSDENGLIII